MRYGEEEDTFSLQRAETGDARLNREHQAQHVNQQKEATYRNNHNNHHISNRPSNNDREIFKSSSSSNFFNNRNGGKEVDEEDEETAAPVNANQDYDRTQKRKLVRKQNRRPSNNDQYNNNNNENQNQDNQQQYQEDRTQKPNRPTGFTNNFAGSSYVPTTTKATTTEVTNNQYTNSNGRRNGQRQRVRINNAQQSTEQQQATNADTPAYSASTPAPFRQTQQYNNINRHPTTYDNGQYRPTTQAPKPTKEPENYPTTLTQRKQTYTQPKKPENYPSTLPATNSNQYESTKIKQTKQTENYPPTTYNTQQYDNKKQTTPFKQTENYPSSAVNTQNTQQHETKKQTTPFRQTDNYPTTFPPKPFQKSTQFNSQTPQDTFPTTFAPRTNAAYTQIAQQTTQYKQNKNTQFNTHATQYDSNSPTTFNQQQDNTRATNAQSNFNQHNSNITPKTTPYTQYTPTVPKIATPTTTPVSRSNRFDETQYDDGSYNSNYDRRDDELINTAHSTNIANSRNELAKNKPVHTTTQKPYRESPRPFSVSVATPKTTPQNPSPSTKAAPKPAENGKKVETGKKQTTKDKNVSYDYAYYDSNVGSEPEYEIPTEIEKKRQ